MAGLGETCTHIAAVLFYLEALYRIEEVQTCTQQQCEWIIPASLKSVDYLPIKDIDFTSARGKKRKLDDTIDISETTKEVSVLSLSSKPTNIEMEQLFADLNLCGTKPAILSLIPKYSDNYIPKLSLSTFPQPLTSLYQSNYMKLEYHDLLNVCENISLEFTGEMAKSVESETRLQSKSKLWFKYQAGRVTASRMKAVCRTGITNPSQSLIKSICYPEAFSFTSKQTEWGCKHEKQAQEKYEKVTKPSHSNLQISENGLFINPQWPFIGASPDGVITCECCTKGVLEIKCPYCHREESIKSAAANSNNFCLVEQENSLYLDHSHAYFYQVQTQLFVCDVEYCDFCMCTFASDQDESTLHIERIYKDETFWDECLAKAKQFFMTCLLPELLGKWYTRPTVPQRDNSQCERAEQSSNSDQSNNMDQLQQIQQNQGTFCYCHGPDTGTMIGCDNKDCSIQWFHIKCLRIKESCIPKGKWYCPDCQKLPKFGKGKGKGTARKKF